MIQAFIIEFLQETAALFLDMAPFLILGMFITGILSVVIKRSMIMKYAGENSWKSIIKAALFGVPLPLCSCGVLPTALYLRDSGASKAAVQSFLISTPQTGFDSIIATYGMLGPVMAVYRALTAFLLGIAGGFASKLSLGSREKKEASSRSIPFQEEERLPLGKALRKGLRYGFFDFTDDIGVQFIIGLLAAGLLTVMIPEDFFAGTALGSGITGMLLMVAVGIPLYMCSTSSIPIAVALMAKGISPGAAFVLLVAGPATNAATLAVLGKKLGLKDTGIYLSVLVIGSLVFGLLLDWMISAFGWEQGVWIAGTTGAHDLVAGWIALPASVLLVLLLARTLWIKGRHRIAGSRRICTDSCGSVE